MQGGGNARQICVHLAGVGAGARGFQEEVAYEQGLEDGSMNCGCRSKREHKVPRIGSGHWGSVKSQVEKQAQDGSDRKPALLFCGVKKGQLRLLLELISFLIQRISQPRRPLTMFVSDGLEKSTLGGSSGSASCSASRHCVGLGHPLFLSEPLTPHVRNERQILLPPGIIRLVK